MGVGEREAQSAAASLLRRAAVVAEVYIDYLSRLAERTAYSLMLLVTGYVVGAVLGFISGGHRIARAAGYPIIR